MKQINPLHLIALFCVVILFLFFKNTTLKEELAREKAAFKESKILALKLHKYKQMYADKRHQQKALERILSQPSLKSSKIKVLRSVNTWKISATSIKADRLTSLMSKLLNGTYTIKGLKIERMDASHAKLYVEIGW